MKKGIFRKIATTWKSMTATEKIGLVLDVVCSIGGGLAAATAGKALTAGAGKIEKVCVRTTFAGLGIVAGDAASHALQENYGVFLGAAIDKAKAKAAEAEKEAVAHE